MSDPVQALAVLSRVHIRLMGRSQFWGEPDLIAADALICRLMSDIRLALREAYPDAAPDVWDDLHEQVRCRAAVTMGENLCG